ncbi:MAG TPA: endonuclease/exonuclease/phosphatase family protein [Paenibacillus sp.]|nr:endonuclease/exonuclease/phosphatase family protein [Paenibacillus sp.]
MESTMTNDAASERAAVVMTFNLRRATWADGRNAWRFRKESAAEAVLAANADVVGTQEGSSAMLLELTAMLPRYDWIGEGRRGGARDETNAILYRADRWAPERSGTFWLSETPERPGSRAWGAAFPRICTWALFRSLGDDGLRWAVFNTHLDHISAPARRRGIELVARRAAELAEGAPLALTGDFNAKPGGEVEETLRGAGWRSAFDAIPGGAAAAGATYHAFRGGGERGRPIDYIYYRGFAGAAEIRVDRALYLGKYPSDHYPASAALRWG